MKKLLIASVMLAAAIAAAHAEPSVPQKFQGAWCLMEKPRLMSYRPCAEDEKPSITISETTYVEGVMSCELVRGRSDVDPVDRPQYLALYRCIIHDQYSNPENKTKMMQHLFTIQTPSNLSDLIPGTLYVLRF